MEFSFDDRVAVVTGAAHGFGRAICLHLARRGARVWGCDLRDDELEETAHLCRDLGATCEVRRVDVTREDDVAAFVDEVATSAGHIDVLVNNAGGVMGQVGRPIDDVSATDWAAIVSVNLTAVFYVARAVAPIMKNRRYGRIVNISSGAGRSISLTGIQAYASAKAGQIGLTRQLAHELGPWGITVNNVAPGFVLSNPTTQRQWEAYGAQGQQELVESVALKRLGTPDDIAYGVLFFASDYAAWCTGQVLSIDGGHALF